VAIRNAHEAIAVVAPQSICRTEPEKPVVILNHPFHQETRRGPGEAIERELRTGDQWDVDDANVLRLSERDRGTHSHDGEHRT
jgi:hypothetical protein